MFAIGTNTNEILFTKRCCELKIHYLIRSFILIILKVSTKAIEPKWNGILNPTVCFDVIDHFHDQICELKNVAVVYPTNQFNDSRIKCPIYELSGLFSNAYGSFLLSKGFKSKEHINHAYLKMREVGVVDRMSKKYGIKKNHQKNFQDHYSDKYKVHVEGVMFDHVKIIVIGYFMFLLIPLIILLIEIMIHKYRNQMLRIVDRLANNVPVFDYVN